LSGLALAKQKAQFLLGKRFVGLWGQPLRSVRLIGPICHFLTAGPK
jgi:hypothetical protein